MPEVQRGHKYIVNIEGTEHEWPNSTITVAEIRQLGGLPTDQAVVEVDLKDNSERTLPEDEVVEPKPGHGFAKKVKYQRG